MFAQFLSQGQYSPGKAQQVCWSPTPHLIIWYVLVLSCLYIQSRFPSKLTTGSPLWNLENNIRTKDQELRLSKFNFMKARCFYAATEQQCCRAAFGAEQSSSCITSRNFARTWDQLHGSKSWNFKKWRLSASHERLCPLHSFAVWCCRMLSIPLTYGYIFGYMGSLKICIINIL